MAKTEPFEQHTAKYDEWFENNKFVFESELQAIKQHLPKNSNGVEIGVGSGRFASSLGIKTGIDPSEEMRKIAIGRGIKAFDSVAESLPFSDSEFDYALMVTTICFLDDITASLSEAYCFLDDITASLSEAYWILKPGGKLIIGFVDGKSPIGRSYQKHKDESHFYNIATFYSADEVVQNMEKAGFTDFQFTHTIFHDLAEINDIELIKDGYGEGGFVVVSGFRGY